MIMNILHFLKGRLLSRSEDGVVRNHTLTSEESAGIAKHERLHALLQQAYRDDTYPEPPSEEEFVRCWRQRRAERDVVHAKPSFFSRHVWTGISLAAAAVLVFFALIYLFAPAGQPVTAGPTPTPHPEMERIFLPAETPSGPDRVPRESTVPVRDM